jgi:hypothetical protein
VNEQDRQAGLYIITRNVCWRRARPKKSHSDKNHRQQENFRSGIVSRCSLSLCVFPFVCFSLPIDCDLVRTTTHSVRVQKCVTSIVFGAGPPSTTGQRKSLLLHRRSHALTEWGTLLPALWPRSAQATVYLKRIRKMADDKCWFCQSSARMTRSHVLLHCPNARLRAARIEAWEGKDPGGVRVLLANPRWERRLVKFLELSGAGRVMADGTDEDGAYAARMDEWVAWETVERAAPRGEG